MPALFPALDTAGAAPALRFGERALDYAGLRAAASATAVHLSGARRVALWATPTLETAVGALAALLAGVPLVPLNPGSGARELDHLVTDSAPELVLAAPGIELPGPLAALPVVHPDLAPGGPLPDLPPEPGDEAPALIVYTSGTTGPPKGAVLPRRAVRATLDALADAWQWSADDVLVHGLPLFHVHGLVLGVLGPLRSGGSLRHLGRFSPEGARDALADGATMLFGVPTMYHRLAEALPADPALRDALGGARLLVSGSAALSRRDHEALTAATGQQVVERYGMTETLMITSVRPGGAPRPGSVGTPLNGVELRLVDDDGRTVEARDGETLGEIQVKGPNLFLHYLGRPDATEAAFDGDWFRTGDIATTDPDGAVRIVGRRSTDLIKSGGYRIGAGEIENVLLEHPAVADAAVTGEPDPDLGERVVAWIVPRDPAAPPGERELADHVAAQLTPYKRPRTVRLRESLPRNDMGKIMKKALKDA
ncbi:acyl-CoA synthetase [Streptomyces candidus]|uniref:Malonyl-CoA/methylmalonyl-CoA synthetase n=1 Tax=Streptomyces candidus TaxID=67283 RepID=A0A7X0HGB6_9ACTN|nr:acyl-CoA synthetase [Streptomyces candidus]MBB6435787.1 malonyl-CoA/methylmalonyl-CoA synthetase [Streptomyces candidus]GHH42444.1 acyl-CoA synthetase [Streptomyces candidus]